MSTRLVEEVGDKKEGVLVHIMMAKGCRRREMQLSKVVEGLF